MTDYKKLSDAELKKKLYSTREELRLFRFDMSGSKEKNIRKGRTLRKEIARIMTIAGARR